MWVKHKTVSWLQKTVCNSCVSLLKLQTYNLSDAWVVMVTTESDVRLS